MKILVACEESQAVCIAFRNKGHEAYSCDIQDCSGGRPCWHIKTNVLSILDGDCVFVTQGGTIHSIDKWDMIIAFPPCTDLAVSGARHFEKKRADGRQLQAIKFFECFLNAKCDKIAIENPVNIIGAQYMTKYYPGIILPKCTQRIQPYEYGHPYTKTTCLWLKNLPKLKPTNILAKPETGWANQCFTNGRYSGFNKNFQGSKTRSKTFSGIAEAMADQWG